MGDEDDLHRRWIGWVTENLGHDMRFVPVAAGAAMEAAARGEGFQNSTQAARLAWETAAGRGMRETTYRPEATGRWERDVFVAWTFLALAWLWPVTQVILNRAVTTYEDWSLLLGMFIALTAVFVIPISAIAAVIYGHTARHHIKRSGDRGRGAATAALVLSYLTLLVSPISIAGTVSGSFVILLFFY
jgi:hypothetical protein